MLLAYTKLFFATILPVVFGIIFEILNKKTAFSRFSYKRKQIIYGLVFGVAAILGTDFGIPMNGAVMNCRDAAVLSAGLFFGAPAGIIAGTIGAFERWIAVYWNVGAFTRVACTLSTFIAGIYSALLRKFMFENKKPGASLALSIGIVMEVFHMVMVFLTNMDQPYEAISIVKSCSVVMIPANGFSVMLSSVFLMLIGGEKLKQKNSQMRISQTIQRWLLVTVCVAFAATTMFIFRFQDHIASSQADSLLSLALDESSADISDASDENILQITRKVAEKLEHSLIQDVAEEYGVADISKINKHGIIFNSLNSEFLGFDMHSGAQAAEFLCLLGDKEEFVQPYGPITKNDSVFRKYAGVKTDYGFVQVGFDADAFHADIDSLMVGITKNRHVGEEGYVLILDSSMKVRSAPESIGYDDLSKAVDNLSLPSPDETFTMTIDGVPSVCRYRITEGYYILSVLPQAEAVQMRNIALWVNTFMEILVFAVLFALIYMLIKLVVVNQIKSINKSLAKITGGDLDEVINVRSNEEFASLSDDINSTVGTLKQYIADASARIDEELEFAKNIQASALPKLDSYKQKRKDFDVYASMTPAKEVGGDFYDFYLTDNDVVHFLIADVSGKGIPAAMFMMRAMTELKSQTEAGLTVDQVFTRSNDALCAGNDAGMFVTAWQGGLDLNDGMLYYANAGHNPPVLRRNNGSFEFLRSKPGFVLAGMEGFGYKIQSIRLDPGDEIFLYTDGVTEATNADSELYGEERLLNTLNSANQHSMKELCLYLKKDIEAFVGDAPQFDDITMLAFRYVGIPTISFEKACIDDINAVTDFIEKQLEKIDCPYKTVIQINVAIDELFSNIIKYGYPDGPGPVTVKCIIHEDIHSVYVRFEDEGIPYNPLTKDDPDITLSAEERGIGGLGIYVVKKTMDSVKYKYENGQNILTIKKILK